MKAEDVLREVFDIEDQSTIVEAMKEYARLQVEKHKEEILSDILESLKKDGFSVTNINMMNIIRSTPINLD